MQTQNTPDKIERKCETCGNVFFVLPSKLSYHPCRFCCRKCSDANTSKRQFVSVEKICEVCGKHFFAQPHRAKTNRGKYCSKECQHKSLMKTQVTACKQCGKEYETSPFWASVREFCSAKCRSLYMRGANHPNYIDYGERPKHYGDNWRRQRNAAIKRDGSRCVVCGSHKKELPEKTLHVHHKIRIRFFGNDFESANSLDNLVTLCIACHRKAEDGRITI